MIELRHELCDLVLSLLELASAAKVNAKVRHEAVHDEEPEVATDKLLRQMIEELVLVLSQRQQWTAVIVCPRRTSLLCAFAYMMFSIACSGSTGFCISDSVREVC